MWKKWIRDLRVELHWRKRNISFNITRTIKNRWRLDTPSSVMGIISIISGFLLFIVIANGISQIFRSFVPWISGSRAGEVYWQSIGFGIKTSFIFLFFIVSLITFILLKLPRQR